MVLHLPLLLSSRIALKKGRLLILLREDNEDDVIKAGKVGARRQ